MTNSRIGKCYYPHIRVTTTYDIQRNATNTTRLEEVKFKAITTKAVSGKYITGYLDLLEERPTPHYGKPIVSFRHLTGNNNTIK